MVTQNLFLNRSRANKTASAFSLIELSIVLIIIGLLIAGITAGATLIRSAELRTVMNEARNFNVAVNSFYVQYDALPGDYSTSVDTVSADIGNNNGQIDWVSSSNIAEGALAMKELQYLNIIKQVFTAPTISISSGASVTPTTSNFPPSKLKGALWVFDYVTISSIAHNEVIIAGTGGGSTSHTTGTAQSYAASSTTGAVLTGNDALSIDTKMDDGVATTGDVRANSTANLTGCISGTAYVNTTTQVCALGFRVDVLQ